MRAQRHLALAVREGVPVEALRDYHLLIACGHAAQLYREPRTQEVSAVCLCCAPREGGHPDGPKSGVLRPTQEERTKSVNWLTDRGHGLPAQSVHIEGVVRAGASSGPDVGNLPRETVFQILHMLRRAGAGSIGAADTGSASADRALPESGAASPSADRVVEAHAVERRAGKSGADRDDE